MFAPAIAPAGEKNILINFPNRLELLFLIVWAFPKASKMGFACRICCSSNPRDGSAGDDRSLTFLPLKLDERGRPVDGACERDFEDEEDGMVDAAMEARYWITFLVFSVLPAPDSPLRPLISY